MSPPALPLAFLFPQAGWALLLLPLLWWPRAARGPRGHRALRAATFACIVMAASQPSFVRHVGHPSRVIVADQRAALSPAARAMARAAVTRLMAAGADDAPVTLVQVGGAPLPGGFAARIGVADASLSTALDRAVEALPAGAGGTISLVADGRSTDRHWDRAVEAATRRGIAVDTIALPPSPQAALVAAVDVAPVRSGEAAAVSVAVEGGGTGLTVTLTGRDGRPIAPSRPVPEDGRISFAIPASRTGYLPVTAILHDPRGERGRLSTVVAVQPPRRLLYLGERQAGAPLRLARLLGAGFSVEAPAAATAAARIDWRRYALVMLDDLPAARLPNAAQRRLREAVAAGDTGLIVSGGEAAFGPGGYARTPLAAALPVTARQDRARIRPSIALAIVIDSSGSMSGAPLDIAKQIARLTARKLTPADDIGVVEFYGAKQWAVPMQAARNLTDVERAIGRMQAQGSSMLFPALQEAFYALKGTDARYRHLLVISDAGVEEERYGQLLALIARNRINVSTVQIGDEPGGQARMADWARLGKGRFYPVADEFGLIAIDFRQPSDRPESGYRPDAQAVDAHAGRSWWPALRDARLPPVSGHARVATRPEAEALATLAGGDPLLTSWHYGAGRVTALATEPLGAGTAGWAGWRDYGAWLAAVVMRTAADGRAPEVTLSRCFETLRVTVRRTAAEGAAPHVVLRDGSGSAARVVLEERAPGLFIGQHPLAAARPALVEVRDGGRVVLAADRALSDREPPARMSQARALPLAELAAATAGRFVEAGAALPPTRRTGGRLVATDLWTWLSLAALLLYLADLLYRRWPRRRDA